MDKLIARLSEQKAVLKQQHDALKSSEDLAYNRTVDYVVASSSLSVTPATEAPSSTAPTTNTPSAAQDETSASKPEDLARLKAELEAAKGRIARMDQELAQNRIARHTMDQVLGSSTSESDFPLSGLSSEPNLAPISNPPLRPSFQREGSWATQEDARSDTSDALSAGGFNRARAIWNQGGKTSFQGYTGSAPYHQSSEIANGNQWMSRGYSQPFVDTPIPIAVPQPMGAFRGNSIPDPDMLMAPPTARRPTGGRFSSRHNGSFPYSSSSSSYEGFNPSSASYCSGIGSIGSPMMGMNQNMSMPTVVGGGMNYGTYQPQPIGTPLSPHAPEFTSSGSQWKGEVSTAMSQAVHYANQKPRRWRPRDRRTCQPLNPSTTAVYLIVPSTVIGNILLTRSSATTISKLRFFFSRS